MYCTNCGKEIAEGSKFCTYCGAKVQQSPEPPVSPITPINPIPKKKSLLALWISLIVLLCLSALGGVLYYMIYGNAGYVDLGLPSGTLWKNKNEEGFYTYDDAVSKFGSKLPTKEQLEELKNSCQWTWQGNGYKVVGPSGESIFLPAAGSRNCNGSVVNVGSYGYYWSSTPNGSDSAWYLYFYSGEVGMYYYYRCYGPSVRLVQ